MTNRESAIRKGERVIVLDVKHYDIAVFNGLVGFVESIEECYYFVRFDNGYTEFFVDGEIQLLSEYEQEQAVNINLDKSAQTSIKNNDKTTYKFHIVSFSNGECVALLDENKCLVLMGEQQLDRIAENIEGFFDGIRHCGHEVEVVSEEDGIGDMYEQFGC